LKATCLADDEYDRCQIIPGGVTVQVDELSQRHESRFEPRCAMESRKQVQAPELLDD
jgi:hypothetical protein